MEEEKNADSTNFTDFIYKISQLNYNITKSVFTKTKFEDINVEEKFQEFFFPKSRNYKIFCDIIIIIAFLASFIYAKNWYTLTTTFISLLISSIFIFLSYTTKKIQFRKLFDHLSILFFSLDLVIKGVMICILFDLKENKEEALNLRFIIYQFVTLNLFLLLKLEADFMISFFYSFLNVSLCILSFFFLENDESILWEVPRIMLWTNTLFFLRKFFDFLVRSIFSEKLRYESLFNYSFVFICGLNCNKIFMKNDEIVLMDNKIHDFLIEVNNINNQKSDIKEEIKPLKHLQENQTIFEKDASNYNRYLNFLVPYNNSFNSNSNEPRREILKLNPKDKNFSQQLGEATQEELNLKDYLVKLNNEEKNKSSNGIILKLDSFQKLGIYKLNNDESPITKYFEVCFRFVSIINDECYYDLLFYDVSEVELSKIHIYKENMIKQKFLAKIAHEFKTPINGIIGLITNMKNNLNNKFNDMNDVIAMKHEHESNDMEMINNELNIIQNLSEYVIILVNDVIEYSKMGETLDIETNLRPINIKEISNFCFEILKCLIDCNSLKYERIKPILYFDERLSERKIVSDEIRIKQVLLNFISNSVKFTKFGKITLAFEIDDSTKSLKITVSDTGIGIKNEDKQKIFNDFIMLNDGKKNNVQGSGLGLSICKTISQKIPMKIGFESTYGEGCTFSISLPLDENNIDNNKYLEEDENINFNRSSFEFNERNNESNDIDIYHNPVNPHFKISEDEVEQRVALYKEKSTTNEENSKKNLIKDSLLEDENQERERETAREKEKLTYCVMEKPTNDLVKKKILIVDDNRFINDSTNILLSRIINELKLNYEIVQLSDGVDIIKHVIDDQRNGHLIKCIITDENMEYINGSEAVKILRDLENRSVIMRVNVISLSSNNDFYTKEKMKKVGMDLTLEKPVSKSKLLESLKELNLI